MQESDEYLRLEIEKQKLLKQVEFERQETQRVNELVLQLRAETQVLKRDADKAAREARLVLSPPRSARFASRTVERTSASAIASALIPLV